MAVRLPADEIAKAAHQTQLDHGRLSDDGQRPENHEKAQQHHQDRQALLQQLHALIHGLDALGREDVDEVAQRDRDHQVRADFQKLEEQCQQQRAFDLAGEVPEKSTQMARRCALLWCGQQRHGEALDEGQRMTALTLQQARARLFINRLSVGGNELNHAAAVLLCAPTLARKQQARVSIFAARALKARHGCIGYRRVAEETRNCETNAPSQRVVIGSEVDRERGIQRHLPA